MSSFTLHPRLQQDSSLIGFLPLCQIRLSHDSNYPWLILIPQQTGILEFHHLSVEQQQKMMQESCAVAAIMENRLKPDKLNIANLGNIVPQLHVHHIARFKTDTAWPGPVWGTHPAITFMPEALAMEIKEWQKNLMELPDFHF